MPASHHCLFTGWMLFLTPNQQCQSTEGNQYTHCVPLTTTTATILWLCRFCQGQLGRASTVMIHDILPVQFTCLTVFSTISLQVFFGLPLGLTTSTSTPYISSPNHCLLFSAHAHTITTCFAVLLKLCHLILVCLSTLYLELYLVA